MRHQGMKDIDTCYELLDLILCQEGFPVGLVQKAVDSLVQSYRGDSCFERDDDRLWFIRAFRSWVLLNEAAALLGVDIYDDELDAYWGDFHQQVRYATMEDPRPETVPWDVVDPCEDDPSFDTLKT